MQLLWLQFTICKEISYFNSAIPTINWNELVLLCLLKPQVYDNIVVWISLWWLKWERFTSQAVESFNQVIESMQISFLNPSHRRWAIDIWLLRSVTILWRYIWTILSIHKRDWSDLKKLYLRIPRVKMSYPCPRYPNDRVKDIKSIAVTRSTVSGGIIITS